MTVGMRTSPYADPTQFTLRQNNPNVGKGGPFWFQNLPKRRNGNLTILRVDCRQDRIARDRNVACQPEQRAAMVGRPKFAGFLIELPKADVCGGDREGHALFALLEKRFDALPPAPLDQQCADKCCLQSEDSRGSEHERTIALPHAGFAKR